MAKSISDEEIQLRKKARRRLIGAIALVILAAVLLPMVLDREPKPMRQDISIEIPEPDSGGFASTIVPVTESSTIATPADSAHTKSEGVQDQKTTTSDVPPESKSLVTSQKLDTQLAMPETKPAPKPEKPKVTQTTAKPQTAVTDNAKPLAAASSAAGVNGFVVQLGAFSSATNAKQLQQKLSANGIKSYIEPFKTPQGEKTRVRAGPFATREAAEKARAKLKTMGLNGIVADK